MASGDQHVGGLARNVEINPFARHDRGFSLQGGDLTAQHARGFSPQGGERLNTLGISPRNVEMNPGCRHDRGLARCMDQIATQHARGLSPVHADYRSLNVLGALTRSKENTAVSTCSGS